MLTPGTCVSCGAVVSAGRNFCRRCADHPRSPKDGVENAGTRLNERLLAVWTTGRHPETFFDPDFVREDRRAIVGMGTQTATEHQRVMQEVFDLGGRPVRNEPLAVRGDRFSLTRGAIRYDDGRSVSDYLVVQILNPSLDRVQRFVLFDPDDFDGAYAELDARWLDSLAPDEAEAIRAQLRDRPIDPSR